MSFYFVKTPNSIMRFFRGYIWRFPDTSKTIYLTFDDGPIPDVTEFVLDVLQKQQIKATFFCVGENVKKNPKIYQRILAEGHQTANHTYNHLNGWKTNTDKYIDNVLKCESLLKQKTKLFRPPYGKITKKQADLLRKNGYKIIMWTVLSGDFDTSISSDTFYNNVIENASSGSIIVFHDHLKSTNKLHMQLNNVINDLKSKGYDFECIN